MYDDEKIVTAVVFGVILICVVGGALMVLGPTPEPYHEPVCLWRMTSDGTPNPTEEAHHAWCLTQYPPTMTPTPLPWWNFWERPLFPTATP